MLSCDVTVLTLRVDGSECMLAAMAACVFFYLPERDVMTNGGSVCLHKKLVHQTRPAKQETNPTLHL